MNNDGGQTEFYVFLRANKETKVGCVGVCVWTTICTTQRKPRETDTNLGVKMNEKIADVEKLGKTSRDFSIILFGRVHIFLVFVIYASGCLISFNLLLARVLGSRLLALIISVCF